MIGVAAEIRSQLLPNTILERYRYIIPLVIAAATAAAVGPFENAHPRRSARSSPRIWSLSLSVSEYR
jgi:hypothetical protein